MLRLASCVVTSYIMSSSHAATSSLLASNACGARKSYSSPRPTSSQTTRSSLSASRRVRCAEVFFFGDPDGPVRSGRVAHSAPCTILRHTIFAWVAVILQSMSTAGTRSRLQRGRLLWMSHRNSASLVRVTTQSSCLQSWTRKRPTSSLSTSFFWVTETLSRHSPRVGLRSRLRSHSANRDLSEDRRRRIVQPRFHSVPVTAFARIGAARISF